MKIRVICGIRVPIMRNVSYLHTNLILPSSTMTFFNYLKYFFFWVGYFIVARLIFVLYHFDKSQVVGFHNIVATFTHGIQLDLSAAGYFSVVPFLLFSILFLLKQQENSGGVIKIYTIFFILISTWLLCCDLELFKAWGYRLDDTFLKYLASPTEAAATVSSYPVFTLFCIFLIWSAGSIYVFNKFILKKSDYNEGGNGNAELVPPDKTNNLQTVGEALSLPDGKVPFPKRILNFLLGILLMCALILPIRGGVQLAPVNQSAVYFSDKPFVNYAAVNGMWNFFVSVFEKTSDETNPHPFFLENEALTTVKSLFFTLFLTFFNDKNGHPDVRRSSTIFRPIVHFAHFGRRLYSWF